MTDTLADKLPLRNGLTVIRCINPGEQTFWDQQFHRAQAYYLRVEDAATHADLCLIARRERSEDKSSVSHMTDLQPLSATDDAFVSVNGSVLYKFLDAILTAVDIHNADLAEPKRSMLLSSFVRRYYSKLIELGHDDHPSK